MEETILNCQDSAEGILTAVYRAYEWKLPRDRVSIRTGAVDLCLFASCKKDPEKPKNNTTNNEDDEKISYEKDYGIDFGGRTFTICNTTNDSAGYGAPLTWGCPAGSGAV